MIRARITAIVFLLAAGSGVYAASQVPGAANGTCLMALERNSRVDKARHAPGSSADYTEILSSKVGESGIVVHWQTNVMYPSGATEVVLRGRCRVSPDGRRMKSISFD